METKQEAGVCWKQQVSEFDVASPSLRQRKEKAMTRAAQRFPRPLKSACSNQSNSDRRKARDDPALHPWTADGPAGLVSSLL